MRFLSDEWLETAARLVAETEVGDTPTAVIEQRVTGAPSGHDISYSIILTTGRAELSVDPTLPPTIVVTESWDTAVAVFQGRRPALDAVLTGDVNVTGDVTSMIGIGPAFAAIGAALDVIRAETSF